LNIMTITHFLVEIEHSEDLDPQLLIARFETGKNLKSLEVLEITTPPEPNRVPYIAY
jgi:hypothetical protein